MFSVRQKREISDAVQKILRDTGHPGLPAGEISFHLHVDGAEEWSWADIKNNRSVQSPSVNSWNEAQDSAAAQQHSVPENKAKMNRAPWPDYAGNEIKEGDLIQHPSGQTGKVIYHNDRKAARDKWTVDYGLGFESMLCLQIGDRGQAVVIVLR
jgi:hypothetical protein